MTIEFGKLDGIIAFIPSIVVAYDKRDKSFEIGVYFLTRNISIKFQ